MPVSGSITVRVNQVTPRVRYTFDLVFRELLGIRYHCLTSIDEFNAASGAKLSYGDHATGDEIFIFASRLLFEKGIEDQQISVFEWNGTKAFYGSHPKYDMPFDPFAATFYLVSRYEEYLPHLRDSHDRYDTTESLAFQKGFLQKPLVNIWALMLKEILKSKYPDLYFPERKYRYISTIDIDNAWAYQQKGFMRTMGAFARSLINFDLEEFTQRLRVLAHIEKDPYDTYEFQFELQKRFKFKSIYFFLLGEYGLNDKNVPPESRKFRSLIKSIADYADAGIHPSYGSNKNPEQLRKEVAELSRILKREVTRSRQHFLVLKLPETYRRLIERDITDDYTMGYALQVGFRASICTPFYFYDLDNEQATNLKIHPFAVMDATLKYYMKVEPEQAMSHILPLIREVKAVHGDFISLWHNESMSENKLWSGWKTVYEQMVEAATAQ
ncbi:MAG TPA: polysaccharide deacetylase family protein [Bacteroidia bacterium]|nr:polysaccharide deacetylase family protein [Bacteroidia bacterium]